VSQSNLSLAVVDPAKAGAPTAQASVGVPPAAAKTELKLMLAYYKSAGAGAPASVAAKN